MHTVRHTFARLVSLATLAALGLAAPAARAQLPLYASTDGNSIEEFTPSGGASTFASDPGDYSELNDPRGVAIDSAGNLYVANFYGGTIEKFTPGGTASVFATDPDNNSDLEGLAFDSAGNLYAADEDNSVIEKFTPGGAASTFAVERAGSDPYGLAFDGAGNLYAANFGSNSIEEFTPGGASKVFARDPGDNSELVEPGGLAFDGTGNLYAANQTTIEKFTPGGAASTFAAGLNFPRGLAFDGTGNLYATNKNTATITKFTPGGAASTFAKSRYGVEYLAFGPGESQAHPRLPNGASMADGQTVFTFTAVPTHSWVDPASATAFRYAMTGSSLFTGISGFPTGFSSPFDVSADGKDYGEFSPGQSLTFDGAGVSSFLVSGINPIVDGSSPTAFPLQVDFSTPTADFTMQAVAAPEPPQFAALGLGALGLLGLGARARKQA